MAKHPSIKLKRPILSMMGLLLASPVASFLVSRQPSSSFPFCGILDGRNDATDVSGVDFDSFNPLKPYKSGSTGKRTTYTGTQVSLRQTTMQELTEKLMNVVMVKEELQSILEQYREFLLEPLEDQEAVLEPGSIYTPGMSRDDRYDAYRTAMDGRIGSCRNLQVRLVLEAMRDFVLSFQCTEQR